MRKKYSQTQFPTVFDVAKLTPKTGVTITGAQSGDYAGIEIACVGDVNYDGIPDIGIGSPGPTNSTGSASIVFGNPDIGELHDISLADLGNRGFTLTGVIPGGWTGASISGLGDVNDDGVADFGVSSDTGDGLINVVFGRTGLGNTGSVSLADLVGSNKGFKIPGNSSLGQFGLSISKLGDVNADGIDDFISNAPWVGDRTGMIYIFFGNPKIGNSGTFELSSLDGKNGFSISGRQPYDRAGYTVCSAEDFNGDGIPDILFTQSYPQSLTPGVVGYIIFGARGLVASGTFVLSNLNGTNGFALIHHRMWGNNICSAIGDVNADGYSDIAIGAPNQNLVYVVFGGPTVGNSGTLNLSTLNGTSGFNIVVNLVDISGIKDFNGDGYDDFMIGEWGSPVTKGVTHVILGAKDLGFSGILNVSDLNGDNGFLVPGVAGISICSVSSAGDFNNDGRPDLMFGAGNFNRSQPITTSSLSKIFVLFGDKISRLLNNGFTIDIGNTLLLNTSHFNATFLTGLSENPIIRFTVSDIKRGRFSPTDNPFNYLTTFQLQDIINGNIQFTHDGSGEAPAFNTVIGDGGLASMSPQSADIVFIHQGAQLIHNSLTVDQGKTVTVLYSDLSAVNLDHPEKNLNVIFIVTNLQHGYFQLTYNPGVALTQFTQAQIEMGMQFVHDGSEYSPNYNITVSDGIINSAPQASQVTFYLTPILVNNSLSVTQGEDTVLSSANLGALDPHIPPTDLVFTAKDVEGGLFHWVGDGNKKMLIFSQAEINNGSIAFAQDGTATPPNYAVMLSNGRPDVLVGPAYGKFIFKTLPASKSTALATEVIVAVVGGCIGLAFLGLRLGISYCVKKREKAALEAEQQTEQDLAHQQFHREVISPIAKKIFEHMNTTYFLGYRSERETKQFIVAIEEIVTQLNRLKVNMNMQSLSVVEQTRLFNAVVYQTKRILVPKRPCCSLASVVSFFKPDISPEQLRENSRKIAKAVHQQLEEVQRDTVSFLAAQHVESEMQTIVDDRNESEEAPLLPISQQSQKTPR